MHCPHFSTAPPSTPGLAEEAYKGRVPHQHSSSSPLPLIFSLLILRQLMSSLKYSHTHTHTPSRLSNFLPGTRTQSPISKITFMPMTPPNLSPDLTSQQFYSHTLYCLLDSNNSDSNNSDVHSTCASDKMALSVTHHVLPCHVPATSMVFLPLRPSLPTEMLTSLQG